MLAEEINVLKNRGSIAEALLAEHDAIEQMLQALREAVVAGADHVECIEILNTSVEFCAAHFADEEEFMQRNGHGFLKSHAHAHRELMRKFTNVIRRASTDGLSLAILDEVDLLCDFHEHVRTYDQGSAFVPASLRPCTDGLGKG